MEWFKTRLLEDQKQVFDPVRKKYVSFSPEEAVRQQVLYTLIEDLNVPSGLTAVEYTIKVGSLVKRCDIVVFSTTHQPLLIVECKAEHIEITQKTLDQAARYNLGLQVDYLMLSNAKTYYLFHISDGKLRPCKDLLPYAAMNNQQIKTK